MESPKAFKNLNELLGRVPHLDVRALVFDDSSYICLWYSYLFLRLERLCGLSRKRRIRDRAFLEPGSEVLDLRKGRVIKLRGAIASSVD